MLDHEIKQTLLKFKLLKDKPFLLHVGSDLERKNRKLLVKMIYEFQNDWDGVLVLAGAPLKAELLDLIEELKVSHRILVIHHPTDTGIIALYLSCEAMVFPSYSEGFGWPIIEV
jgi:glycosyltransferase involved in cell wall biosynthesis